jgi:hypothetical protein
MTTGFLQVSVLKFVASRSDPERESPLADYARLGLFGTRRLEIAWKYLVSINTFSDLSTPTYGSCRVESLKSMSSGVSDHQRRRIWAFTALKLAKHCTCPLNIDQPRC